jgi:16S rRNA (cytosine967-C5)-methyltransferase
MGEAKGIAARRAAAQAVEAVLARKAQLERALEAAPGFADLEPRDRAFARMVAATALRRIGQIDAALDAFLTRKPKPEAMAILRCAAAELIFLKTAPHAVVNSHAALADSARATRPFKGLINAVLRRVAEGGAAIAEAAPVESNLPGWLRESWIKTYGLETARAMVAAHLGEPPLDLTAKGGAEDVARLTGGRVLPTGTVRLAAGGRIEDVPGFNEGVWWVQDAASALPARLLAPRGGETVFDLCAAPGGKALQCAAAGARVTAVDASAQRLERVTQNLARTGLRAEIVAADVLTWRPGGNADAVLLDAPCSATGTLRRSPDAAWLRRPADIETLGGVQAKMLDRAAELTRPGGRLVYCVCSLQPEEGEAQIAALLARRSDLRIDPAAAGELPGLAESIRPDGTVCVLPSFWSDAGGLDGFFIARLKKAPFSFGSTNSA